MLKAPSQDAERPAGVPVAVTTRLTAFCRDTAATIARWSLVPLRPPMLRNPPLATGAKGGIGLAIVVIVASMFLIDGAATDWAHDLPRDVVKTFAIVTNFGLSGWFLIPLGAAFVGLAAVASPWLPTLTRGVLTALAARCGFLFLAIGLPGLFDTIVKRLIGRARPNVGAHDDPFAYLPFGWRSDYASMPSGHSVNAAAAAVAIGALWPAARPAMWLYALVIMISRVAVVAHHPSDVIAGALVGVVGADLVRRWFAARRLVFSATDLRAFPGPSRRRMKAIARQIAFGTKA